MKTIELKGRTDNSKIIIGESFGNLRKYIPKVHTIIITDENVKKLYQNQLPDTPIIEIGTGEKIKSLDTIYNIYQKLLEFDATRSTFILAVGGGIVCDIAGFVASTFMRGLKFGFVATTLLAQVDAAIGGKNGVNLGFKNKSITFKNIIGTIRQPEFVICDSNMLETLPANELYSGFAEAIKTAAIADYELFGFIEYNSSKLLHLDKDSLENVIYKCASVKAGIVEKDEFESGKRRILNFGHTFGHAFEAVYGLSHGEAISIGMALALDFSVKMKYIPENISNKIKNLLKCFQLPITFNFKSKDILTAIKKDKKKEQENIKFVFLKDIGSPFVQEISIQESESFINDLH